MEPAEAFLRTVQGFVGKQLAAKHGGVGFRSFWTDLVAAADCEGSAERQQEQPEWRVYRMVHELGVQGWSLPANPKTLSRVFGYTQRVGWFGPTELKKQDGTTPANVSLLMFRHDPMWGGHMPVVSEEGGVRVGGCVHGMLMRLDDDAPVYREFRWMKPNAKGEPDYHVPRGHVAFAAVQKIVLPNEPHPVWKMEELPQPAPACV